jgi:hypothetical protein
VSASGRRVGGRQTLLVEFLGPSGTGKSSVARRLAEELAHEGLPVHLVPRPRIQRVERVRAARTFPRRAKALVRLLSTLLRLAASEPRIALGFLGLYRRGARWPCSRYCGEEHPRLDHLLSAFQYSATSRRALRKAGSAGGIHLVHEGGPFRNAGIHLALAAPSATPGTHIRRAIHEVEGLDCLVVLFRCDDDQLLARRVKRRDQVRGKGRPSRLGRLLTERPQIFRNRLELDRSMMRALDTLSGSEPGVGVITLSSDRSSRVHRLVEEAGAAVRARWASPPFSPGSHPPAPPR